MTDTYPTPYPNERDIQDLSRELDLVSDAQLARLFRPAAGSRLTTAQNEEPDFTIEDSNEVLIDEPPISEDDLKGIVEDLERRAKARKDGHPLPLPTRDSKN